MNLSELRVFRMVVYIGGLLLAVAGALAALENRIDTKIDKRVGELSASVEKLDGTVGKLATSVDELNRAVGRLEGRIQ